MLILTMTQRNPLSWTESFPGLLSLDAVQLKYPTHKGELLAVILELRKFKHILKPSHPYKDLRWLKEYGQGVLSSFNFNIIHRPEKQNLAADALRRTLIQEKKKRTKKP